jgi:hypothetical protein
VKRAAEILSQILDQKERQAGETYSSVFGAWSQIAGGSLAEHSRIYEISGSNLFVEVDHPGWMQLLLMKKNQIIRSVRKRYPALNIGDLKIKVNLDYSRLAKEDAQPPAGPNEEEAGEAGHAGRMEEIDRILSAVSREDLKVRLKRLFLRSLQRDCPPEAPAPRG